MVVVLSVQRKNKLLQLEHRLLPRYAIRQLQRKPQQTRCGTLYSMSKPLLTLAIFSRLQLRQSG